MAIHNSCGTYKHSSIRWFGNHTNKAKEPLPKKGGGIIKK